MSYRALVKWKNSKLVSRWNEVESYNVYENVKAMKTIFYTSSIEYERESPAVSTRICTINAK